MNAGAARSEVDRLVRAGQIAEAAQRLEDELGLRPPVAPGEWLQLAGLRRALKQPRRALDAVYKALALAPLDFAALTMRAGLLHRLDDPNAGEAWGEALAQRPSGTLPPPLAAAIAEGEAVHRDWLAQREGRLAAATAAIESTAQPDEIWRITRFRDNALRKTRVFHSEPTHFHFPGLAEREFHPRHLFPWLEHLEAATDDIRAEMLATMKSERAELVPYLEYSDHEALAQWRELNRNLDWTAIHLLRRGERVERNAQLCPRTMAVLDRIPLAQAPGGSPNAMFSLLAPGKTIPPHVGVNNTRLVCHLPLVVPPGCWFRVGAETRAWREGEAFVFDDTIEHEAANPSDELRVVLIVDVWHPGLSEVERRAVSAMVGAAMAAPGTG